MPAITCTSCGLAYPKKEVIYKCLNCGGIFDYDGPPDLIPAKIKPKQPGIWRYKDSFGISENASIVTLGEGNTPLIWADILGRNVGFKMESQNPTGSYKDRGTASMISHLISLGVNEAVEDSSGNAGASFAAYAARVGMIAKVFVPESASGPKRNQILKYGAKLHPIPGLRANAAKAVLEEVERGGIYASHAYLPFGLCGIATIAYEIWEQMGTIPGTVISPAGHGGLLLGIIRGFAALYNSGLSDKLPFYIGVQAKNCSPIFSAFEQGWVTNNSSSVSRTIAEGVSVPEPTRLVALRKEMPKNRGRMVSVEEELILPGMEELAKTGIFVEPTSALPWCALKGLIGKVSEPIILVMSGSGLKYSEI